MKKAVDRMKLWSLLVWVTQLGFSALFPVCFFLLAGSWLQNHYGWDQRTMILCGFLGVMTSIRTTIACVRNLRKEAEKASDREEPPAAFNEHE